MKKRFIIAAIALVSAVGASAQVGTVTSRTIKTTTTTREVEVDFNKYNRISLSYAGYGYNCGGASDYLTYLIDDYQEGKASGFMFEYIHGWRLTKSQPVFLESGLACQFNSYDSNFHVGIAIPLDVTYRYTASNGFYVAPLAGFNLGINALDDILQFRIESSEFNFKRFQLGYNVGANFGYKRLNIGIGYRGDFMPSLTTEEDGNVKTGTFHIGLGINF